MDSFENIERPVELQPGRSTSRRAAVDNVRTVSRASIRRRRLIANTGWYALLIVLSLIFVFPLVWMVSTSLKVPGTELVWPPQWIPRPLTFENYQNLFTGRVARYLPFLTFLWHSTYIAALVVVGRLLVCSASGFAFARMRFPGSGIAFGMLMISLLMPSVVMIIPLYSL